MDQTKDCTRELIAKAHNNDKEAREKLVTDNLGLIWNIIKRFKGRGTEQEDLFQIGCIGLIKAIDNFNLDMDVAFSTYAVPMITGEIRRFLRDDGMVKVSRSIKENAVKSITISPTVQSDLVESSIRDFLQYFWVAAGEWNMLHLCIRIYSKQLRCRGFGG